MDWKLLSKLQRWLADPDCVCKKCYPNADCMQSCVVSDSDCQTELENCVTMSENIKQSSELNVEKTFAKLPSELTNNSIEDLLIQGLKVQNEYFEDPSKLTVKCKVKYLRKLTYLSYQVLNITKSYDDQGIITDWFGSMKRSIILNKVNTILPEYQEQLLQEALLFKNKSEYPFDEKTGQCNIDIIVTGLTIMFINSFFDSLKIPVFE